MPGTVEVNAIVCGVAPLVCATVARSLARSLPVLVSPPPLTVAVLSTVVGALAATSTVSVIAGKLPPAPITSVLVQLFVGRSHVQPDLCS